ncbi:MAG TPA: hypothetical protein PKI70_03685, partial [Mesotoga sp.]|nr:hypothetical protein [Mesotoga sp.]
NEEQILARVCPSGLIFISPVFDLGTIQWSSTEDKAFALSIPAYVASAWFHGKVTVSWRLLLKRQVDG